MTTTQGASAEPNVLTIPTAIMEMPCAVTLSHFPTRHEMAAYKQGHRDARHAAADLVLARVDELKALAAQPAAPVGATATNYGTPVVPEGYVLVPKAMTDEMRDAGNEIVLDRGKLAQIWRAMLAAVPQVEVAPQAEQPGICSPNCLWGDCPPCVAAGVQAPQAEQAIPRQRWSKEAEMMESWAQAEQVAKGESINESVDFQAALVDLMVCVKNGGHISEQSDKIQALTDIIDAILAPTERAAAPADLGALKVYGMAKTEIGDPVHCVGKFVKLADVEELLATRKAEGADKRDADMWRALVRDTDAAPCVYPCLRDDLADWVAHQASAPTGDSAGRAESGME